MGKFIFVASWVGGCPVNLSRKRLDVITASRGQRLSLSSQTMWEAMWLFLFLPKYVFSRSRVTDLLCGDLTASASGYASCSMVSPGLLAPETQRNRTRSLTEVLKNVFLAMFQTSPSLPPTFFSLRCVVTVCPGGGANQQATLGVSQGLARVVAALRGTGTHTQRHTGQAGNKHPGASLVGYFFCITESLCFDIRISGSVGARGWRGLLGVQIHQTGWEWAAVTQAEKKKEKQSKQ